MTGPKHKNHPAIDFSIDHPWVVIVTMVALVLALGALIPRIKVDTDPENMLPEDQPARVLHNTIKERFGLWDMVVVGMVNEQDESGIFNQASLGRLYQLSRGILEIDGVIGHDLMSLAAVDNISQEGPGTIRFQWMMDAAPTTGAQVEAIRSAVERLPLLRNTLVSEDGRAAGIYVPIERKDESHRIATEIGELIADLGGNDEFHITGLPVAEDTFGVEMFRQMAISAPLAGLVIFLVMWIFFRSLALITAPMILAMATVIATMGLLIGFGFTVHIMSSMIPIFLMPIAVVDSVHVLSEFADRYRPGASAKETVREVMSHLFVPMLFTSITTVVGFASLALTPIPPVRVFGLFIAGGIAIAFLLTMTFIPAYIVLLPERWLAALARHDQRDAGSSLLARSLRRVGPASLAAAKPLTIGFVLVFAASLYGVTRIHINDNPVRWFEESHPIRIADRVLNEHFAGTYNAFLVLDKPVSEGELAAFDARADAVLGEARAAGVDLQEAWSRLQAETADADFGAHLNSLAFEIGDQVFEAEESAVLWWEKLQLVVDETASSVQYFQTPEALRYLEELQSAIEASPLVGKVNSLVTLTKTVYRELQGGTEDQYQLPSSTPAIAQTLLSFQSSHRPDDLWHMVTPNFRASALWLQLASGDNQDMVSVIRTVDEFTASHPLPDGAELQWGGLTYINTVWQEEMVSGMLRSLLGSFVVVLIIMALLFRSLLFGLLAMVPLSFTIAFIYGLVGFAGRDYDMPIAVLSSLTLGLSVDFAIHFLQRARTLHASTGSWRATVEQLFEEPARAITRNAVVIALGFTPLLAAPLIPYQTVGIFLATIMAVSALVTMILLPALMHLGRNRLFPAQGAST